MRYTDEQRQAIDSRGENLLLSAAAGSGKTAVLVERALQMARSGEDLSKMLIVTFTRAAASEMRMKLIAKIRASDAPNAAELAAQAERARVCTIHAFCADFLREHFEAADVDPLFRMIDEAELTRLSARAMDDALEAAYADGGDDMDALDAGRGSDAVAEMAKSLYAFSRSQGDPEGWLAQCADTGAFWEAWVDVLVGAARERLGEAASLAKYARANCVGGAEHYLPVLDSDVELLETLCAQTEYEALREAVERPNFAPLRGKKGSGDDPDCALVKKLRDDAKAAAADAHALLELPLEAAREDARALDAPLRALTALTLDYARRLDAFKAERNALNFDDLEHDTLRALKREAVRESARKRFSQVFVDEYQDVNGVQEAILSLVSRGDNLFLVGDVKQSIYRFRLAEPELFLQRRARYLGGEGGRALALTRNFRSRAGVLEFVNRVFERALRGGRMEIDYDEGERLRPGGAFEGDDPPVELHILDGALPEEDSPDAQALSEMTGAQREGLLAARRIRELVGQPYFDAKANAWRPLEYRDFTILCRTASGVLPPICEVLLREGIPAYADASAGYFGVLEVRVAMALLRLIDNRRLDVDWLAVLRSPIGGFTSGELAEIRLSKPDGSYAEAIAARIDEGGALGQRLRALSERLDIWRTVSRCTSLGGTVLRALRESGYYAYVGALPGGAQRQANLDALAERAEAFDRSQEGGLAGFARFAQSLVKIGHDMNAAPAESDTDNEVRLMTAHKSKGLEFPVVIGVGFGRAFRASARRGEVCVHRTLGVGLEYVDRALNTRRDTVGRKAVAEKLRQENVAEEMRVLYVLLTRASDRLILIGSVREREAAQARFQARAEMTPNCYLDAVYPAARAHWVDGEALSAKYEAQTAIAPACEPEDLREALAWRYPHEDAVYAPVKLTVTGLTREVARPTEVPELLARPRFAEERALTGSEAGTLAHAAMQRLSLAPLRGLAGEALRQAVAAQIDALPEDGRFPQRADAGILARFFERDVGRRLLASDEVRREWTFTLRMSEDEAFGNGGGERLLVQGSIDCCFLEDGEWVLLDYKTDRARDEAALVQRYRPQIALYAKALEQITGRRVRQRLICLLRAGREIAV